MGIEIERKFLVRGTAWRQADPQPLQQGYLSLDPHRTVRVRRAGKLAWLTVKGIAHGISRAEFEYPIPAADADALLALCDGVLIEKNRHIVHHAGMRWEVDEFLGANAGLVVAELELTGEDQTFAQPPWLGPEVSADPRYANANLARRPFRQWDNRDHA